MTGKMVKIKNTSNGPLFIDKTWEPGAEHRVVVTNYHREGSGYQRTQSVAKKILPGAMHLLPGQVSDPLPEAAARSVQVAGLHRAKMIKVFPA